MINPYQSSASLFSQMHARQTGGVGAAAPAQPAASLQKAAAPPAPIAAQEAQRIQGAFPESPVMSMRLYGRTSGAQTIAPGSLGGHLDLRG
jgi:hypothetical protein